MGKPEIRDYILRYRDRYTAEALRDQLIRAGYAPEEVDQVGEEIVAGATPSERPPLRTILTAYAIGLFALTLVLFAFGTDWLDPSSGGLGGLLLVFLFLALVVVLVIVLFVVRRLRVVALGVTSGIVTGLLIPFIAVVIVAGVCIQTAHPAFFAAR
jgi:hypothetical protein